MKAVFAAVLVSLVAGIATAGTSLSSKEQAELAAGRLVTRPERETRGSLELMGGASFQVVKAPVEHVWRAMRDVKHYPQMLPAVNRAQLIVDQGELRVVRLEHKVGFVKASYDLTLRYYPDRHDLTFSLDDVPPRGPRAAWGYMTMRPHSAGHALVSWGIKADLGRGLLLRVLRPMVHDWMLRVPEGVKRFVESPRGKKLYERSDDTAAVHSL